MSNVKFPMAHVVLGCRPQCSHYFPRGHAQLKCNAGATYWIYAPDGEPVPGGFVCEEHGRRIHDEYLAKLGEDWPLVPLAVAS